MTYIPPTSGKTQGTYVALSHSYVIITSYYNCHCCEERWQSAVLQNYEQSTPHTAPIHSITTVSPKTSQSWQTHHGHLAD